MQQSLDSIHSEEKREKKGEREKEKKRRKEGKERERKREQLVGQIDTTRNIPLNYQYQHDMTDHHLSLSLHVLMMGSHRESSSSSTNHAVSIARDSQLS